MEPFTSNDTYACPECGSEVRVGARSCPGCGPFRPVDCGEDDNAEDVEPTEPFHSMTTYTDTREVLEQSRRPVLNVLPPEQKPTFFPRAFLIILIALTLLSALTAALKILMIR